MVTMMSLRKDVALTSGSWHAESKTGIAVAMWNLTNWAPRLLAEAETGLTADHYLDLGNLQPVALTRSSSNNRCFEEMFK